MLLEDKFKMLFGISGKVWLLLFKCNVFFEAVSSRLGTVPDWLSISCKGHHSGSGTAQNFARTNALGVKAEYKSLQSLKNYFKMYFFQCPIVLLSLGLVNKRNSPTVVFLHPSSVAFPFYIFSLAHSSSMIYRHVNHIYKWGNSRIGFHWSSHLLEISYIHQVVTRCSVHLAK